MELVFDILIPLSLIAVVVPLVLGVVSMARGGEHDRVNANKYMRWRVQLQFVAVVILALAFWYKASH